jgi:hypothetical protein
MGREKNGVRYLLEGNFYHVFLYFFCKRIFEIEIEERNNKKDIKDDIYWVCFFNE